MSFILAIESDPRQAAALSEVVKDRVPGAQLTVVDSKDGALAAIRKKAPDLILVTVLFSPREEEEVIAHLRTLEGAEHLQTVTIPLLDTSDTADGRSKRGLFGLRKKKTEDFPTQGCDPVVFAEQIVGYLKTAADLKSSAEASRIAAERAARRASETAAEAPTAPVSESPTEPVETIADTASEPMLAPTDEPTIATAPEPMAAPTYQPVSAPDPQPMIEQAPEPAVRQAREQPLVGYPVDSPGEPLSKEEGGESAAVVDSTPEEPQIFGSVLFAKLRPKRVIKPFTEAPPAEETRAIPETPSVDDTPIVDETPAVAETPIIAKSPVVLAPPAVEPPPPIEEARVFPAIEPLVRLPAAETRAAFSIPPPAPLPEPQEPVRLVNRLPPLAMWARRLQEAEAIHAAGNGDDSNGSDDGPLGVLRIPPAIATISYPTGCRIRRVIAKPVA